LAIEVQGKGCIAGDEGVELGTASAFRRALADGDSDAKADEELRPKIILRGTATGRL
jgi:hypothetical protein